MCSRAAFFRILQSSEEMAGSSKKALLDITRRWEEGTMMVFVAAPFCVVLLSSLILS